MEKNNFEESGSGDSTEDADDSPGIDETETADDGDWE